MSMNALMWAWTVIQNEMDLKIGARLVLLNLADRANGQHETWPGVERIASDCNLTAVAVRSAINLLVQLDLVERTPRKGGSGENRTNFYRLKVSPNQGKHSLARGSKKTAVKGGNKLNPNPKTINPNVFKPNKKEGNQSGSTLPIASVYGDDELWETAENLIEVAEYAHHQQPN